jgi:hypothetical protein
MRDSEGTLPVEYRRIERGAFGGVGFDAHRHVVRLAVVQIALQVAEGDFRRGRGDVVDRQGRQQLAQRVAGRDVVDAVGQAV